MRSLADTLSISYLSFLPFVQIASQSPIEYSGDPCEMGLPVEQ